MKASLALAIFISAVLVGAVWIVYLNRASEKIVSAALPIAAAAVLALCLSVFVFGADPPQAARFEVSYTINMDDKKPSPEAPPRVPEESARHQCDTALQPSPSVGNHAAD
jgi:hypothetical protein